MTVAAELFQSLTAIMRPHCAGLDIKHDSETVFYADTFHIMKNGKPLYFGSVEIKKRYVAYHLMPLYVHPLMLESVSETLRRRMQGKSCFNFTKLDEALFSDIQQPATASRKHSENSGSIQPS